MYSSHLFVAYCDSCQRCLELQERTGGVQAIVTGMKGFQGERAVQEGGLKIIADACITLATCAEV